MFVEVKTDYIDDKGVIHIDGYKDFDENSEGVGIGYIIHGQVYWRDPEYQYDPLVKAIVADTLVEQKPFILDGIDYTKLKEQKATLINLNEQFDTDSMNGQALDGIISLIDHIQDFAVDVMGKSESEVFNLSEE